jgi:hypothetical protein
MDLFIAEAQRTQRYAEKILSIIDLKEELS